MSNINKQALRKLLERVIANSGMTWYSEEQLGSEDCFDLPEADAELIAALGPKDVLALLDELEAADALNKHLELAIRKAEGCSEALRRKTEAAEKRIAELEAREVKLPPNELVTDAWTAPGDGWEVFDAQKVVDSIRAAGVKIAAGIITKVGE